MSLLDGRCVQLEHGAAGGSTSSSDFTQLLRGSVQVEPRLDLPRLTSSHTLSNSLSAARSSHLRRVLLSTGWYGWRCELQSPRGPWECNFHLRLMVLAVR